MEPYGRSARYYDLIYGPIVDYRRECDLLERAWESHANRKVERIMDLGCGTGNHALVLASRGYTVLGIDLNEEFVSVARGKTEGLEVAPRFRVGDMRDPPVEGPFGAIISMFGAFSYLPRGDAPEALRTLAYLLEPGGLLLFEWWNAAGAIDGHKDWLEREEDDLRLVRLGESRVRAEEGVLDINLKHIVIRGERVEEVFTEHHPTALYAMEEMGALLEGAGLEPVAMLDWTRKSLEPPKSDDFRVLAVARRA